MPRTLLGPIWPNSRARGPKVAEASLGGSHAVGADAGVDRKEFFELGAREVKGVVDFGEQRDDALELAVTGLEAEVTSFIVVY